MIEDPIILIYAPVLFMLGIVIGYAIGTARVHLPLINYFRDYYERQAEMRMAQHTRFLLSWIRMFGGQTVEWGFRSRAGQRGAQGQSASPLSLQQSSLSSSWRTLSIKERRATHREPDNQNSVYK